VTSRVIDPPIRPLCLAGWRNKNPLRRIRSRDVSREPLVPMARGSSALCSVALMGRFRRVHRHDVMAGSLLHTFRSLRDL
jgi:hypothetical protein